MSNDLDVFGKFIMENLRDVSIKLCNGLIESKYESPGHKEIQKKLNSFTSEDKKVLMELITYCVDGGINDFLYRLDKQSREKGALKLLVNGKEAKDLTESLSKELHGKNGWQKRFSEFNGENT
jgi:RNA binding exosome subunit